jgi:hypothetical protein
MPLPSKDRPRALYPVKPLKKMRQLRSRNADARVPDCEFRPTPICGGFHHHRDLALERIFKHVGEQVEDNFFPHVMVDIDRLRQRLAVNDQSQAGPVDRGTEV